MGAEARYRCHGSHQNQCIRPLAEWVEAVNAHGGFGRWRWDVSYRPGDVKDILLRHGQPDGPQT